MRLTLRRPVPSATGRLVLASSVSVLTATGYLTAATTLGSAAGSAAQVPVPTTTSMTMTPSAGATVTMTATVLAVDGTSPAGQVLFEAGGSVIGPPVPVVGGRTTSAATQVASAGPLSLSAVFNSASPAYLDSSGEYAKPDHLGSAIVPLTASVLQSGQFAVSIAPGTVSMTVSGSSATGTLQDITVTDTRSPSPGWEVSGQVSAFVGAGTAFGWAMPGNQLGWTPIAVRALEGSAVLGRTVAPGRPGLGVATAAATLAVAPRGCGSGTNVLSAKLLLTIPLGEVPGPYEGTMTITYVDAGPQDGVSQ